jgi:glycosyltransferase involved in cell wall biosynthesis
MSSPAISIVIPIYNTAPFLADAIQSILDQTFKDFECIIINDGSTDDSDQILRSFQDKRIRYLQNDGNRGIVYTLNRGIDEAVGSYIARMDGDDLSVNDRLEKQLAYMKEHPKADMVATTVNLIDEQGFFTGQWSDDRAHVNYMEIRTFMPDNNCIAHPTVFAKADVLRSLKYRECQREKEDYDLWLRWLNAGYTIHKVDSPLVKHRIRQGSTTRNRQKNISLGLASTKFQFIAHELKHLHLTGFVFRTFIFSLRDLSLGILKKIRQPFVSR